MNENKKSRIIGISMIVVIIIFIGIFVVKKMNQVIEKPSEEETIEIINEPDTIERWSKLEEFPENSDDVEIVMLRYEANETDECDFEDCEDIYLYENVKDYRVLVGKMNIMFNCTNSNTSDECGNISFTIDNKIKYLNDKFEIDKATSHIIYKTKDNYVIKEVGNQYGEGLLYVYDKNGNLLQTYDNTVTKFNKIDDKKVEYDITYQYYPSINSNYLYYVHRTGEFDFTNGLDSEIEFSRINLSKEQKIDNLYTLKALTYDLP